jgi:hypothetical protein
MSSSWGYGESNPFALDFESWMPVVAVPLLREGATIVFNRFWESHRHPANGEPSVEPPAPHASAEELVSATERRGKSRVQLFYEELVNRHIRTQVAAARPVPGNPSTVTVRFNEAMLHRMAAFTAALIAEHAAVPLQEGANAGDVWAHDRTARLLAAMHKRFLTGLASLALTTANAPADATSPGPTDAASNIPLVQPSVQASDAPTRAWFFR